MTYYGGLDIGTSGSRILVTDSSLNRVFEESRQYQTTSPREGWEEQEAQVVYRACAELIDAAAAHCGEATLVLAFSSVMHSLMAVDSGGSPQSPLIPWMDGRSLPYCRRLQEEPGHRWFFQRTACPLHPSYWPGKILWLKDNLENAEALRYVSIKEYVLHRLTGRWFVDYSVAASSGIFNLSSHAYDPEILRLLEIPEDNPSQVVPPETRFSFRRGGTEVVGVTGSADGVLANLGVGAVHRDQSVLTVGSSSAARYVSERPVFDRQMRAWCYMLDREFYVVGEATNAGGMVLHWLAGVIGFQDERRMTRECAAPLPYPPNDLFFIPTLLGERAPDYNEELRGLFSGLAMHHGRGELVSAVYEGILFFNRMILEDLARVCGSRPRMLLLTGGLGTSERFRKLVACGIQPARYLPQYPQSTALGAVMLAVKAETGRSLEEQAGMLPAPEPVSPLEDRDFRSYLEQKYRQFRRIYETLNHQADLLQ